MSDEQGRDLLQRTLDDYTAGREFAEPVATVRRRIRQHRARTWTAAGVGALVVVSGVGVAIGRVATPSHDTLATKPTPSATRTLEPSATPPTHRVLTVSYAKPERRVVVARPWGSGSGAWGLRTGGDGADAGPGDVVTDGRGRLYVLDGVNRRLRAYAATTGRSLPQASATLPVGVYAGAAVDEANGDVYVMNELSNRLLRIAGGRVVGSTPAHLPGLTFSHLYASNGTVDIVTAQGDPPQPRRLRLLAAGEPNTDQRLQPIPPSPTAPAFTVSDTGRLTVAFGPDSTVRVDFGDPVVAADTIVVAAPGVVWSTVTTRVRGTWQRWLTRITPDGAVAMPLREPTTLPYENHSGTLAVTPTSAYLLTGDTAGGRVVEYTPGAAERR